MNNEIIADKENALKDLRQVMSNRPVVSNENHEWVLDCLRIVGKEFCMTIGGKTAYIELSPRLISEALESVGSAIKPHHIWEVTRGLDNKIIEARLKCEAIIDLHLFKEEEEKEGVRRRVKLEESTRSSWRY